MVVKDGVSTIPVMNLYARRWFIFNKAIPTMSSENGSLSDGDEGEGVPAEENDFFIIPNSGPSLRDVRNTTTWDSKTLLELAIQYRSIQGTKNKTLFIEDNIIAVVKAKGGRFLTPKSNTFDSYTWTVVEDEFDVGMVQRTNEFCMTLIGCDGESSFLLLRLF
eukprot:scaffold394_cov166-Amphora_coffeaeformis.AAC.7